MISVAYDNKIHGLICVRTDFPIHFSTHRSHKEVELTSLQQRELYLYTYLVYVTYL